MRRLVLDKHGLPTGVEVPFAALDAALSEASLDNGFVLSEAPSALTLSSPERCLRVELLSGYGCAQVFAPADKDFVALEPMTAATGALSRGAGLRIVQPGEDFTAAFRIRVESLRQPAE